MAAQRSKAAKRKQPASDVLRLIPAVDRVLELPDVAAWARDSGHGREFVAYVVNVFLQQIRGEILSGELDRGAVAARLADAAPEVRRCAAMLAAPDLRRVINATGVVVHTNLGRSPWPASAAHRVAELSQRYLNLEFDLATGGRGQRGDALERLVRHLLPGAAVAVVNNNAAAVLLVLNTVAQDKEVVVSRGQLVEIGGSFRIPEVMQKSQSVLREVGTTNRTRQADFEAAIGPRTGALLSVHPSNYRVVGFTEEADLTDLVDLGHRHGVPVVEDLGSGCLFDIRALGIRDEPTVAERLGTGVDLITFSGDKLLGGPQAGFIVGNPEWVARVRKNPLYRALRLDKTTTLALEATLAAYVTGNLDDIPTVRMLRSPVAELEARARALAERLLDEAAETTVVAGKGEGPGRSPSIRIEVVPVSSRVGGGAAPGRDLPSFALAIDFTPGADELMAKLRAADPPVIGRIVDDRVVLDVRTVLPDEDRDLIQSVLQALNA